MALEKFKSAPLPNPPAAYDPQYLRQLIRVIELYFSQLDSLSPNQAQSYRADAFYGGTFDGTDITGTNVTATNVTATNVTATNVTTTNLESNDLISATGYIQRLDSEFAHIHTLASEQIDSPVFAGDKFYGGRFYGDGRWLEVPYNQFQSNQDQTAASAANAYAITLNQDDFPNGISVVSNSRITVTDEGVYLINISIQFQNDTNSIETADVWFRRNGTDIPASNSQFTLAARKSAGIPASLIAAVPFMVDLAAGDYVEIMWRASLSTLSIQALPAVTASPGVTPAIPATPSVLVNIGFVSAQHPPTTRVAPLPVIGFGQIGNVSVSIS